ncbi:MAG: hypothetical protein V4547_18770 [Bacteroidota bacterium]
MTVRFILFMYLMCSLMFFCSCALSKPTTITKITTVKTGVEVVAGEGFNQYWKVFISIPDSVKVGTTVNVNGWNRYTYSLTH